MAGMGIIQAQIATWLQIDLKTLRKHFRRELDTGAIEANVRVANALYTNAVKHNQVTAQIWWTKARMGWKETQVNEQTGPDGSPLTYVVRAPMPIESAAEWLRAYAPKNLGAEIEIDGEVSD
jgi:hypothetical protein